MRKVFGGVLSALLLAAATVVFNIAGTAAADGALWAVNVCSTAPLLCQMPYVTWVPAVALGASWAVLKATDINPSAPTTSR